MRKTRIDVGRLSASLKDLVVSKRANTPARCGLSTQREGVNAHDVASARRRGGKDHVLSPATINHTLAVGVEVEIAGLESGVDGRADCPERQP